MREIKCELLSKSGNSVGRLYVFDATKYMEPSQIPLETSYENADFIVFINRDMELAFRSGLRYYTIFPKFKKLLSEATFCFQEDYKDLFGSDETKYVMDEPFIATSINCKLSDDKVRMIMALSEIVVVSINKDK